MKRMFAVACMCALLTGCTVQSLPGKTENHMAGCFTADVTMTNAESETKATLTRYGTDAWCVVFNDPAALSGVQLDFLDDEVTASYKGLAFSVPQSAQALKTELSELMEVVDSMAINTELDGTSEEGMLVCEGELEVGSYSLCFTEEGLPVTFSLPAYGLVITFDSFTETAPSAPETETIPKTYPIPDPTNPEEANEDAPPEEANEEAAPAGEAIPEQPAAPAEAAPEIVPEEVAAEEAAPAPEKAES